MNQIKQYYYDLMLKGLHAYGLNGFLPEKHQNYFLLEIIRHYSKRLIHRGDMDTALYRDNLVDTTNHMFFNLFLHVIAKEGYLFRYHKEYYMLGNYIGPLDREHIHGTMDDWVKNKPYGVLKALQKVETQYLPAYHVDYFNRSRHPRYFTSMEPENDRKLGIDIFENVSNQPIDHECYSMKDSDNLTGTFICDSKERNTAL